MGWLRVGDVVPSSCFEWQVVVGYVRLGVWCSCAWEVVGDRVVDGLAADGAVPADAADVLTHAGLHCTVARHGGLKRLRYPGLRLRRG